MLRVDLHRKNRESYGTRQRGLSLVELMVGIAVGLFVVAGASLVVSTQLGDNRRLLLETQLQQDLRAAMDIVTREIRRAGAHDQSALTVWNPAPGAPPVIANNFAAIDVTEDGDEIVLRYRRGPGQEGPYGFKVEDEKLKSLIGGTWQELTDPAVMRVTGFTVTPEVVASTVVPCPRECSGGGTACWPTLTVRDYKVDISAASQSDAAVQRSMRTRVRVRNDWLAFNDAAHPGDVCPQ